MKSEPTLMSKIKRKFIKKVNKRVSRNYLSSSNSYDSNSKSDSQKLQMKKRLQQYQNQLFKLRCQNQRLLAENAHLQQTKQKSEYSKIKVNNNNDYPEDMVNSLTHITFEKFFPFAHRQNINVDSMSDISFIPLQKLSHMCKPQRDSKSQSSQNYRKSQSESQKHQQICQNQKSESGTSQTATQNIKRIISPVRHDQKNP